MPYYFLRRFLPLLCAVVEDRGLPDFIVWIVVTLGYPGFLESLLSRFLAGLAVRDAYVYVTADLSALAARVAGTPLSFLLRELACYRVLSRYYARCVVDRTRKTPS